MVWLRKYAAGLLRIWVLLAAAWIVWHVALEVLPQRPASEFSPPTFDFHTIEERAWDEWAESLRWYGLVLGVPIGLAVCVPGAALVADWIIRGFRKARRNP